MKNVGFLIGYVGILFTVICFEPVKAQFTAEQRLCRYNGQ